MDTMADVRVEAGVRDAVMEKRPDTIARMFDAIARRYDVLNHVLSGGSDWYWRWRAIRALRPDAGATVLDVCTGTCDLALEAIRRGRASRVIGLDFAGEMLRMGKAKLQRAGLTSRAPLIRGDAMRIPLADASVDAITIAFGIRNVQSAAVAITEMARVLRSGGRLAVLEFSMPRTPVIRSLYAWYFRHVLPRIGRLVSKHGEAYAYLPSSVGTFSTPEEFSQLLKGTGFCPVRAIPLTLGVVYLYLATKPTAPSQVDANAPSQRQAAPDRCRRLWRSISRALTAPLANG
jgi:demethylmenaquinone methyltransferase/2-methoxy-6-polyprenyl-1,4-benzoquinol methylase